MARPPGSVGRPQPGAPPPPAEQLIAMDHWKKMNTKLARQNLPEDELAWAENVQPIGANQWQATPGALAALTTLSGKTVSRLFPANIAGVDYIISFNTDGSAIQVNANTGVQTVIAAAATFSTAPDMTVFTSSRLLIADATSGYVTWDGTLFVKFGGLSPNINVTNGGSGYSAPPTVGFTGGSGSGATATAVMGGSGSAQFVVAVTLTNPGTGYKAGDVITVTFTGANTTPATATARIWPNIPGTTIAVFAGRVWIANGRVLNFTGTAGFDDTATANAAGSTTIADNDLPHQITALRALNNYLYIFGDQSIRQIGSITVSSSITQFTTLTLASDIGTSFMMSIQSYNRLVLFANKNGVYGIFGATVQKLSDDLDGIFKLIDFSLAPSSALNDFHTNSLLNAGGSIHCYMLLVKYMDPLQGTRQLLLCYQTNQWFLVSQGALIAITSAALLSTTQWEPFGSIGADITNLLQDATVAVPILLKTALTSHGELVRAKQAIKAGVAVTTDTAQNFNMLVETEQGRNSYPLAASSVINWVNNSGSIVQFQNNSLGNVIWVGGGFRFPYSSVDGYGKVLGVSVSGTVSNLSVNAVAIEYKQADLWGRVP